MPLNDLKFFNPCEEIAKHRTQLPHWEQPGATYFVTFRLADSLPQSKLHEWTHERQQWLLAHPLPWTTEDEAEYHQRFIGALKRWLDQGHGSCALRDPEAALIVRNALLFFEGQRTVQHCFVIMPNHVHAVFSLLNGFVLEDVMQSWKGFTAHRLNEYRNQRGECWQRDYFDRVVRDREHFWNCARYVRRNPWKAKLRQEEYLVFEAEWVKKVLGTEVQ